MKQKKIKNAHSKQAISNGFESFSACLFVILCLQDINWKKDDSIPFESVATVDGKLN